MESRNATPSGGCVLSEGFRDQRTAACVLRVWLLEAQLKPHHEIHPAFLVGLDGLHDPGGIVFVQSMISKYGRALVDVPMRHFGN